MQRQRGSSTSSPTRGATVDDLPELSCMADLTFLRETHRIRPSETTYDCVDRDVWIDPSVPIPRADTFDDMTVDSAESEVQAEVFVTEADVARILEEVGGVPRRGG